MLKLGMLNDAIRQKRLMIVAGAGVSMLAPSNLPSWWGFNESLLEAIKSSACEFVSSVADTINQLSLDKLPVQAFSELIVTSFAGESYFPLLQVLESAQTNMNHRALAELARRGVLRGVVTPNFDSLIERAFRELAVPLDIHVTREHFLHAPRAYDCRLYKIHGSVTRASTLVDTVSQKKRGLPVFLRERLEQEFAAHHLLIMGFSGADLQFDDAYLPFVIAAKAGLGVTWLIRPGSREKLPARARAAIDRMGDRCELVEADLPGFFARTGLQLDPPVGVPVATAGQDAHGRMNAWVRLAHIGPPTCAAFCARLFETIGDEGASSAIIAALRSAGGVAGPEISLQAGLCLQVLALDCIKHRQHAEAVQLLKRQLQFYDGLRQLLTLEDHEESSEAKRERLQNQANVYNNLGVCLRLAGNLDEASKALQQATRLCQEAEFTPRMGTIMLNQALIAESRGHPAKEVLDMLTLARDWASRSGDVRTEVEAVEHLASTLVLMGEYDAALECLERVEPLIEMIGLPQHALKLVVQRAGVYVRRGLEDEALHLMMVAAETHAAGSSLRNATDWQLVRLLMHSAKHRPVLVSRLNSLLLHDKVVAVGVPEKELLSQLRDILRDDPHNVMPAFLQDSQVEASAGGRLSDEELRKRLIWLEYLGKTELIPGILNELTFRHYNCPRHQKRLARATIAASRRAGSSEHLANGLNHLGVACDLLGELDESIRAYGEALQTTLPKQRAMAMANLTLVRSRTVDLCRARQLFQDCIEELDRYGHLEEATRTRMCLAIRLADESQYDEGIIVGGRALDDAIRMSHKEATLTLAGLVAAWKATRLKAKPSDLTIAMSSVESVNVAGRPLSRDELDEWRKTASGAPDIANLAIAEIECGDEQHALEHLEEARRLYEEAGDQLGLSRCCNNMASLFHARQQWGQAIDWSEKALRLRYERMDWRGVVLTLSNLASYCVAAERWQDAVNHANQCTTYEGTVSEPRCFALAWIYLAWAQGALGEIPEARRAIGKAERWMVAVNDEQLRGLLKAVMDVIAPAYPAQPNAELDAEEANFLSTLKEVERLTALGQFQEAHATLDAAESKLGDRPTLSLARIVGTRGNVLQRSDMHQKAVDTFHRAAAMFRNLRDEVSADSAEMNATSSLRELGRIEEACQILNRIADRAPTAQKRATALVQLAKAHWQPLEQQGLLDRDSPEFQQALALYTEAQSLPDLPRMLRGIVALDMGQLNFNHGDRDLGISQMHEAKSHFIDANAQEADYVDHLLQQLAKDDA